MRRPKALSMFFPLRDDQPRFSTPVVNYFIIALNVAAFLFELSVARQSRYALDGLFAQFGVVPRHFELALRGLPNYPLEASAVTIFTAMFLHGGWSHIIVNMWALWIFGDNVEDAFGHFKYLLFYLTCGVVGNITHILLNLDSRGTAIGASGAIAGVMGAYLLLYPRAKVFTWVVFIFFLWLPAWVPLIFFFVSQLAAGTASIADTQQAAPGVAVWAHIGGFAAGMILVTAFSRRARAGRYGTW